ATGCVSTGRGVRWNRTFRSATGRGGRAARNSSRYAVVCELAWSGQGERARPFVNNWRASVWVKSSSPTVKTSTRPTSREFTDQPRRTRGGGKWISNPTTSAALGSAHRYARSPGTLPTEACLRNSGSATLSSAALMTSGGALLNRLAVYYYVPVFDMGVKIDSNAEVIRSVNGRVTTLAAGSPCLFCRGRISADGVHAESIATVNPAEADRLRQQGYAPELHEPAPAVIPFTTAIAASAVCEMLHRLSGFRGSERLSSEVLHLFDQTRTRTNSGRADPDCFCQDRNFWGRGDVEPFLDSTWRPE